MRLSNLTFKDVIVKPYKEANLFYTAEETIVSWQLEGDGIFLFEAKIPKGFITDLSSAYKVPLIGKKIFKMDIANQTFAVCHDYLCSENAVVNKYNIDGKFHEHVFVSFTRQSQADDFLVEALRYQYKLTGGQSGASDFNCALIKLAISLIKWRKVPVMIFDEQKQAEKVIERSYYEL